MNEVDQSSSSVPLTTEASVADAGAAAVVDEEAPPSLPQDPHIAAAIFRDAAAGAIARGDVVVGLEQIDYEEAPTPGLPQDLQPTSDTLKLVVCGDANEVNIGGNIEMIDDEEAPPILHSFEGVSPKTTKMRGTIEEIQVSEPPSALTHDDSLQKKRIQPVPVSAPFPDAYILASLSNRDSLDGVKANARKITASDERDSVIEPEPEDETDAQPARIDPSIPQPVFTANERSRGDIGTPYSRANLITADVQTMSPYINDSDEICIPEATAVNSDDIPSATLIRPDKYSLTIAGHKIQLRFLALGVLSMLGVAIALAVILTKNGVVDPGDIPAYVPSSAPSVSLFPSSNPSVEPTASPTSILHAELVGIISEYTGGNISSSFPDNMQSNHRMALNWLVDDQSKWREKKEPLSNVEIVERFVLALLYFETDGGDWSETLKFLTEEHVWNNNLQGGLPTEIGLLTELVALQIGLNDIHGNIPDTLGLLTKMTHIVLDHNDLSGPIDSLTTLSSLRFVDLSSNEMTGSLMNANNLTKLEQFKVNGNHFTGPVPESFSDILTLDYRLDCSGDKPEIECNCCIGCTIVNDVTCDPATEKLIVMDIFAGNISKGFEWELKDSVHGTIAAGGEYNDGQHLNIQLCLSSPGSYTISMRSDGAYSPIALSPRTRPPTLSPTTLQLDASVPTPSPNQTFRPTREPLTAIEEYLAAANEAMSQTRRPTSSPMKTKMQATVATLETASQIIDQSTTMLSSFEDNEARISFTIDGYNSLIDGGNKADTFDVTSTPLSKLPANSSSPSFSPTRIVRPIFPLQKPTPPSVGSLLSSPCDGTFELVLTTDSFGMDTSWDLIDRNGGDILVSESGFASNQTLQFSECLDMTRCYDFVIKDAWDDGICCQQGRGSYTVSVDERLIGRGGEFGSSETVFLGGSCGDNTTKEWASG
ncbi:hypothetical protein ACHAXR_006087 [Thalassiosira sp. AJA248-18]